jgi:hypothetical protein
MAYIRGDTLSVRISSYEQNGQTKFRYKNVGHVLTKDSGEEMLLLDRTFNPAGALPDGRDCVILYRFKNDNNQARSSYTSRIQPPPGGTDDDIPF